MADQAVQETDPTQRYIRFKEVLGRGSFKTVYAAFDTTEALEVAWNKLHVERLSNDERSRIMNEVRLLGRLNHRNIIRLYDSFPCASPDGDGHESIAFITEQMMSGTLKEYLKKARNVKLKVIRKWCYNILDAIAYLHSQRIMHRDLKLDNLFMNGHVGEVKIGDLGLSSVRGNEKAESVIGTPEFMAPELYEESYTEKVDIYAFGMCLLEMVTMEYPYAECKGPAQIMKKVVSNEKPASFNTLIDCDIKNVIAACLAREVNRPSAAELLSHPLFRNWEQDDGTQSNQDLIAGVTKEHRSTHSSLDAGIQATIEFNEQLNRDAFVEAREGNGENQGDDVEGLVSVEARQDGAEAYRLSLQWPIEGGLKSVTFSCNPGDRAQDLAAEMVSTFDLDPSQLEALTQEIENQVASVQKNRERGQQTLARSPQVNRSLMENDGASGGASTVRGAAQAVSSEPSNASMLSSARLPDRDIGGVRSPPRLRTPDPRHVAQMGSSREAGHTSGAPMRTSSVPPQAMSPKVSRPSPDDILPSVQSAGDPYAAGSDGGYQYSADTESVLAAAQILDHRRMSPPPSPVRDLAHGAPGYHPEPARELAVPQSQTWGGGHQDRLDSLPQEYPSGLEPNQSAAVQDHVLSAGGQHTALGQNSMSTRTQSDSVGRKVEVRDHTQIDHARGQADARAVAEADAQARAQMEAQARVNADAQARMHAQRQVEIQARVEAAEARARAEARSHAETRNQTDARAVAAQSQMQGHVAEEGRAHSQIGVQSHNAAGGRAMPGDLEPNAQSSNRPRSHDPVPHREAEAPRAGIASGEQQPRTYAEPLVRLDHQDQSVVNSGQHGERGRVIEDASLGGQRTDEAGVRSYADALTQDVRGGAQVPHSNVPYAPQATVQESAIPTSPSGRIRSGQDWGYDVRGQAHAHGMAHAQAEVDALSRAREHVGVSSRVVNHRAGEDGDSRDPAFPVSLDNFPMRDGQERADVSRDQNGARTRIVASDVVRHGDVAIPPVRVVGMGESEPGSHPPEFPQQDVPSDNLQGHLAQELVACAALQNYATAGTAETMSAAFIGSTPGAKPPLQQRPAGSVRPIVVVGGDRKAGHGGGTKSDSSSHSGAQVPRSGIPAVDGPLGSDGRAPTVPPLPGHGHSRVGTAHAESNGILQDPSGLGPLPASSLFMQPTPDGELMRDANPNGAAGLSREPALPPSMDATQYGRGPDRKADVGIESGPSGGVGARDVGDGVVRVGHRVSPPIGHPVSSPPTLGLRSNSLRSVQSDESCVPSSGVVSPANTAAPAPGDVPRVDTKSDPNWSALNNDLMYSASSGDQELIREKLVAGALVTFADYDKRTPLHLASAAGSVAAVELLLKAGADVNAKDRWGAAPIRDASQGGHLEVMQVLKRAGAVANDEKHSNGSDSKLGDELVHHAAVGNIAAVKERVQAGVSVTHRDYESRTALHLACSHGHADVVDFLLLNGADPLSKDRVGRTPVDNAMRSGHRNVIDVLRRQEGDASFHALLENLRVGSGGSTPAASSGQAAVQHGEGKAMNGNGPSSAFSSRPRSSPSPNPDQLDRLKNEMAISHSISMGNIGIESDLYAAAPPDSGAASTQSLPLTPYEESVEDVDEEQQRVMFEYEQRRKTLEREHRAKMEDLRRKKTTSSTRSSGDALSSGGGPSVSPPTGSSGPQSESWMRSVPTSSHATPLSGTPGVVSGTCSPAAPHGNRSPTDNQVGKLPSTSTVSHPSQLSHLALNVRTALSAQQGSPPKASSLREPGIPIDVHVPIYEQDAQSHLLAPVGPISDSGKSSYGMVLPSIPPVNNSTGEDGPNRSRLSQSGDASRLSWARDERRQEASAVSSAIVQELVDESSRSV